MNGYVENIFKMKVKNKKDNDTLPSQGNLSFDELITWEIMKKKFKFYIFFNR